MSDILRNNPTPLSTCTNFPVPSDDATAKSLVWRPVLLIPSYRRGDNTAPTAHLIDPGLGNCDAYHWYGND